MYCRAFEVTLTENPTAKVMYMSGEEFVNEYIESMHQKTGDVFRKKYRFLDCFFYYKVKRAYCFIVVVPRAN